MSKIILVLASNPKNTTPLKEIQSDLDVLRRKLRADEELKPYKAKLLKMMSGDERLLHVLLEAFGGDVGVLRESGVTVKNVFQDSEGEHIAGVEEALARAGYRTELSMDEEHGAAGGTKVEISWELASQVEFQKPWKFTKACRPLGIGRATRKAVQCLEF